MSTDETYNGWANRETWAVALHINNDQGWQDGVHEALRAECTSRDDFEYRSEPEQAYAAGEIIRESVEESLDIASQWDELGYMSADRVKTLSMIRDDIGSLWRVAWTELGEAFLRDLDELNS